ncbi:hypothetical protein D3C83_103610 [compost metagenome]
MVLRNEEYEVFPNRPSELSDELLRIVSETFEKLCRQKESLDQISKVLKEMVATLTPEIDKENYPKLI